MDACTDINRSSESWKASANTPAIKSTEAVETSRFYRSESTAMQWFLYNDEAGAKIEFSITRKFANEPV